MKIGDVVKFTHMHERDLNENYSLSMQDCIGKIGEIVGVYNDNDVNETYYEVKFQYGVTWFIDESCLETGHLEWVKNED